MLRPRDKERVLSARAVTHSVRGSKGGNPVDPNAPAGRVVSFATPIPLVDSGVATEGGSDVAATTSRWLVRRLSDVGRVLDGTGRTDSTLIVC